MKTRIRPRGSPRRRGAGAALLRLLVVVGDSPSAGRAIDYSARVLRRYRRPYVCLAYALPPLPPELQEFGGAEDPAKEKRLEAALRADQRRWISTAKNRAKAILEQACLRMRQAGVQTQAVEMRFLSEPDGRSIPRAVVQLARRHRCNTVVLGHRSHSWLGALFHREMAEELLRRDKALTLWLVGEKG